MSDLRGRVFRESDLVPVADIPLGDCLTQILAYVRRAEGEDDLRRIDASLGTLRGEVAKRLMEKAPRA